MKLTNVGLALLCLNLIVLGGLLVLIALRGPSVPAILLAVGTAGMAVAKIRRALTARCDATAEE
jgi:hypothetical protein